VRILFVGDIVGKAGRETLRKGLPGLVAHHFADAVVVNGENAAAGHGITREIAEEFFDWGVDVITTGNHVWARRETLDYIGTEPRLLRPANYPAGAPGNGSYVARLADGRTLGVINAMGRVFMDHLDNPFEVVFRELAAVAPRARVVLVDFHAEATSEKQAMGWHLDGRVTAVIGTHTHVQTADERILLKGTAFLADAGMTGAHDAVIGMEIEPAMQRFVTGIPARFEAATANPRLNGVVIEADDETGRAVDIERISYGLDELTELSASALESSAR
jgi:metallophosphoesterase (TIGR00282 family)